MIVDTSAGITGSSMQARTVGRLTYRQLMTRSEDLISANVQRGTPEQRTVVARLIEDWRRYHDWEAYHAMLMRSAANASSVAGQVYRLRAAVLSLAHLSALPRVIRNQRIRGTERVALLTALHRNRDYVSIMLAEHRNFIRAEASSMCACYIDRLLGDRSFSEDYAEYVPALDQYMSLLRDAILAEVNGEPFPLLGFLGRAKRSLSQYRARILGTPSTPANRRASAAMASARLFG